MSGEEKKSLGDTTLSPYIKTTTVTATTAAAATHQTPQQQQQFQRLKVEDALSYLDQVKFKFNNQPQVYNDFLDIMKEFKSQSIDTPGVIQRVSNLFRGHPELIVGFNTFLPPGYKIEMQSNDQVNVSMPSSTSILIIHNPTANSVTSTSQRLALPTSTSQGSVHTSVHLTTASTLPGQIGKPIFSTTSSTPSIFPHNQNTSASIRSVSSTDPHHISIAHGPSSLTPQLTSTSTDSSLKSSIQTIPIPVYVSPSPGIIGSLGTGPGGTSSSGGGGGESSNLNTSSSGGLGPGGDNSTSAQPVEFNHAINYVNKIKNRFQGQPEVYKQFLEILHAYQKEQKCLKEGIKPDSKPLNESQVYAQVAKLFQNQEDLLQEFGQFLPDANAAAVSSSNSVFSSVSQNSNLHHGTSAGSIISTAISAAHHVDNLAAHRAAVNDHGAIVKKPLARPGGAFLGSNMNSSMGNQMRKQIISIQTSPNKPKMTSLRDVTLAEAGKYGSLNEYAFFDKVRKTLRSQEVYENFLRCLFLYNHEIVSRNELVLLVTPFLGKFPELLKFFKDFLGYKDGNTTSNSYSNFSMSSANNNNNMFMEGLSQRVVGIRERDRERMNEGPGAEINYAACKRYGASYRALPKSYVQPECSGRTPLCREVLNDTWVSFPSWSEDSTFVTSKKTQYEEFIYRCEDERFELDVIIETNLATIRVLEGVQKRLSRMGPDERAKFKLDECLGGTSAIIHQRSIRRIYGDKSNEIIDGLKKNPVVAVPLVLKRLKNKEEEWKESQKSFNKIWREQCEKYYLKSLDHQGISFKQNDIKYIRSKSLINEIETFYEERHEQNEENIVETGNNSTSNNNNNGQNVTTGPHMTLTYKNRAMIDEACNLIIHHVKRQTSIHKEDKQKIKQLLKHFIPDMFATPRGELSDDELEDFEMDKKMDSFNETNRPAKDNNTSNNTNNSVICIPVNLVNLEESSSKSNNNSSSGATSGNNKTKNETESGFNKNNNLHPVVTSSSLSSSTTTTSTTITLAPITATNNSNNNNGQSCVNGSNNLSTGQSKSVNPMLNKDPDDSYSLFFVNNYWYLFFRLHYILCDRLAQMHERTMILIAEEEKEKTLRKESTAAALRLKPKIYLKDDYEVEEYFIALIDMVKQVLDGNLDFNQFEDQLREMFGIHAYIAFTLDKVVQNIVRQLQHIVGDETCITCNEMFVEESKANATGGPCSTHYLRANAEASYQKKAEQLMAEGNCFKIILYKGEGKVTIELICPDSVESEDGGEVEKWSEYVEKYAKEVDSEISDDLKEKLSRKPVFLPRNLRMWRYKESKEKEERAAAELGVIPRASSSSGGGPTERPVTAEGVSNTGEEIKIDETGDTSHPLRNVDDTQCKFNVNSYKMVFVVQSESYLCKRNALARARQIHKHVSQRLHGKFDQFHQSWLSKEVTNEQRNQCDEWLSGRIYENQDVTMKSIEKVKETPKEALIEDRTKLLTASIGTTITLVKSTSSTIPPPLSSSSSSSSISSVVTPTPTLIPTTTPIPITTPITTPTPTLTTTTTTHPPLPTATITITAPSSSSSVSSSSSSISLTSSATIKPTAPSTTITPITTPSPSST